MQIQVAPLAEIYELNTDLLLNCLADLTDAEARQRLSGVGNSVAFLAAHLTDTRHFLVTRLGHPLPNPLARYLAEAQGIEDIREWMTLEEIRGAWLSVSAHLHDVLDKLAAADLGKPGAHRFPIGDSTPLGMLTFLAQHDSYHVGQIGFIRRQLGKPAMSYERRARQPAASGTP
jgi:uncharacterized damage-inducible protein DinB